jgi:hypothetical protein
MKYFALGKKVEAGSPPFLNGLLHDRLIEGGQDVPPEYAWYWVGPGEELAPLPKKLYFHTKDPQYLFDMRSGYQSGDYFVSEGLLDVIESRLDCKYQCAPVELVSNFKTISGSKKYLYLRLDRTNFPSESILEEFSAKVDRRKTGEVKKIWSLPIDSESLPAIFMIRELSIASVILFSDDVCQACMKLNPVGVEFVPSAEIGKLNRI